MAHRIMSISGSRKACRRSSALFSGCFLRNSSPMRAFGMNFTFRPYSCNLRRPISTSNLTNGSPMIPLERLTIATFFIIFLPPHSNCVFAYIRQFYAAFPYGTGLPHARQNPTGSVPASLQKGVFSLLPAQGYLHSRILSA